MKKLFLLSAFLIPILLNAQLEKNYTKKYGDSKVLFTEKSGDYTTSITYESYLSDINDSSGYLLEWRFGEVKQPIHAYWHMLYTPVLAKLNALLGYPNSKLGEVKATYHIPFINGKVNGLLKVNGFSIESPDLTPAYAISVINGTIVGKQSMDKKYNEAYWLRRPDIFSQFIVEIFNIGAKYNYSFGGGFYLDEFPESSYYTLEDLVEMFLEDFKALDNDAALAAAENKNNISNYFRALNLWEINDLKINARFTNLNGETIAISSGINKDSEITIRVDPEKWKNASSVKKWYILYHELGHDVLNLEHGQGGRMMFNFPTKEYTWEEFFMDRDVMFDYYLKNKYKYYAPASRFFTY
jgi:hypothetical protein